MEEMKDSVIRCRLERSLHDEFKALCKDKALNASELLRKWIQNFVWENKKDTK